MKLKNYYLPLLLGLSVTTSCSTENEAWMPETNPTLNAPEASPEVVYPENDGSKSLSNSNPATNVRTMLDIIGPEPAKSMGNMNITDAQYEEIKKFTDELVSGIETDADVYRAIFNWVSTNVQYGFADNDPYPVFTNKTGVCQGYANLLNVMLHTQGIPVFNVNGMLNPLGGHAWNYVYYNNRWFVSDPTNRSDYAIYPVSGYKNLEPHMFNVDLAQTENEVFSFKDKAWTITRIRKADDILVLPYSGGGIVASCFNPDSLLPANVKEIYIGKNIKSLGSSFVGLRDFAPNIEAAFVDDSNTKLKSHLGVVYTKSGSELVYIPQAMKSVELLPIKVMEKNYITNHKGMEEVILPNGTEELQDYAFENCPNLKRAYIPEDTKVSEKAFYSVHADFQIIRGNITGIPEITM
jgi:hypothetical protein